MKKRLKYILIILFIFIVGGYFYTRDMFGDFVTQGEVSDAKKYCESQVKDKSNAPKRVILDESGRCGVQLHTGLYAIDWYDQKNKVWISD